VRRGAWHAPFADAAHRLITRAIVDGSESYENLAYQLRQKSREFT
jgi:hypothetical protein